jgi:hypothetical protein
MSSLWIVFLTGVSAPETLAATGVELEPMKIILVTVSGVPFTVIFREIYNYEPGAHAIGGYFAVHLIDAAVSSVDGRFTQRDDLHRALTRARENLP